jgi:hypothetical protein
MLTLFMMMVLGCQDSSPPQVVVATPKPPKAQAKKKPKRRPRSASSDTGNPEVMDFIDGIHYAPKKPSAFDDIEVMVDVERGSAYVDVDIRWAVNGKTLIAARSSILPKRYFSKGDTVTATVSVKKGGNTQTLEAKTLTIANTPPRILTNPSTLSTLDGFRIRAEDPDGGRVSYHLKGGPTGMSLGKSTGVMRYKPNKAAEGGAYDIVIVARDEDAAESEWRFSINISPGSQSKTAKDARAKKRADWEAKQQGDSKD